MMNEPVDRTQRMQRALVSLRGLAVGDAFGEQFFGPPGFVAERLAAREIPPPRWPYTDDTAMALSVVDVLAEFGRIEQDALARAFAARHDEEPNRGYGAGARQLLRAFSQGLSWREVAPAAFGGAGSHGTGAALRAGPIGAYFAEDIERTIAEATAASVVTHAHPEGIAGAVAVALGAAYAVRSADQARTADGGVQTKTAPASAGSLLAFVEKHMPAGETRLGVRKALAMPEGTSIAHAASVLGSGLRISAADTVPFALWCAARHLDDYESAIWDTVEGLGDRDTTCAIVGSIVALRTGADAIPERWRISAEPLGLRYHPDPDAWDQ